MLNKNITKQYNLPFIGGFLHVVYQTLPLFSIVSNVLTASTFYKVWEDGLKSWFSWMSLPIFLAIVMFIALIAVVVVYKFIYKSYFGFLNNQQFQKDHPLIEEVRKVVREEIERAKNETN